MHSCIVIGRSIGLHDTSGPLFDCGDVQRVYLSSTIVSVTMDADQMLRFDHNNYVAEYEKRDHIAVKLFLQYKLLKLSKQYLLYIILIFQQLIHIFG